MTPFAVTGSFALYRAFREECEEAGWKYAGRPDEFSKDYFYGLQLFFSDNRKTFTWSSPPFLGTPILFDLGSQYDEALEFAKEQIKPKGITPVGDLLQRIGPYETARTYATEAMRYDRAGLIEVLSKEVFDPLTCKQVCDIINNHPLPELP